MWLDRLDMLDYFLASGGFCRTVLADDEFGQREGTDAGLVPAVCDIGLEITKS